MWHSWSEFTRACNAGEIRAPAEAKDMKHPQLGRIQHSSRRHYAKAAEIFVLPGSEEL
jgi:hypothetical protein